MSYTYDEETALTNMVHSTERNDQERKLTMYAIVCPEHGGLVAPSMPEALAAAKTANAVPGHDCEYFAVAIGLAAEFVSRIFADPPEGS